MVSHSAPEIGELVDLTNAVVVRCPLADFPSFPSLLNASCQYGDAYKLLARHREMAINLQSFGSG
jgi:hypothetical protein